MHSQSPKVVILKLHKGECVCKRQSDAKVSLICHRIISANEYIINILSHSGLFSSGLRVGRNVNLVTYDKWNQI